MARKVKDLAIKSREYTDKEGNRKANWVNIGVVMENDDGKQFMLIDKWINFAGIPDFKNPNSTSVMVTMFDVNRKSNYQPPKQMGDPSSKGNDNLDDWNSSPKVPEVDEIPF